MKQASPYSFIKPKKSPILSSLPDQRLAQLASLAEEEDAVDTNVISIDFKNIKESEENLQMGDPYFCKKCSSSLSSISSIFTKTSYEAEFHKTSDDKEEKKIDDKNEFGQKDAVPLAQISEHEKIWVCEFCGNHNVLSIEKEEIPTKQDIVYITQSAKQVESKTNDSDFSVVFCIDNSGSMSVTHEVQGKHDLNYGLSQEEYEMLKQFIEAGASQYLPGQKKNTTYISRKQCVLAAIENQVLDMKKEFPQRKVGLVTFNDEVCIIGDGKQVPETIAGDKLTKYDLCQKAGEEYYSKLMSHPVKDAAENLISKFKKLEEKGKTALGPGLIVSIAMAAQGRPGSKVILCTDGLANVGLGEMDSTESVLKANDFYAQCAEFAKSKGVSISVISIKGEGCKLEVLGKLVDETSGDLTRVDPSEITNNFANILKDEVLATGVTVKLRLHKGLKFRNEQPQSLSENGTVCTRETGNVTRNTELTFEYDVKNDEELSALGIDASALKTVPFQALITYTSTKGDKLLRIITQQQKTTDKLEVAEKEANMKLLACRALQHQALMAQKGDYDRSSKVGAKWDNYLETNVMKNTHDKKSSEEVFHKYQERNSKISSAVISKSKKSAPKSSADFISGPERMKVIPESQPSMEISRGAFQQPMKKVAPPKPNSLQSKSKPVPKFDSKEKDVKSSNVKGKVDVKKEVKEEVVLDEANAEDEAYEVIHQNKNISSDF